MQHKCCGMWIKHCLFSARYKLHFSTQIRSRNVNVMPTTLIKVRDFRLPPRSRWGLRYSWLLRSEWWWFLTDVSVQPVGTICKGQKPKESQVRSSLNVSSSKGHTCRPWLRAVIHSHPQPLTSFLTFQITNIKRKTNVAVSVIQQPFVAQLFKILNSQSINCPVDCQIYPVPIVQHSYWRSHFNINLVPHLYLSICLTL
jgi:hypothetical protein